MTELSVTVTAGQGSERHNHDLDYRQTLEHVHGSPEDVIELIPYQPYRDQINEALRPYIDEYNKRQQERYAEAWERHKSSILKTKPRKRDYTPMGYDYYTEHEHDMHRNPRTGKVEELPMWRSFIIGIGDQADRQSEKITEEQAKRIMAQVVDGFAADFPAFLTLGATLHLDEAGFYHMHLDFKPLYEKKDPERGLAVGVGLDGALESMGYKPEQSVINGRDKVPILFNTMRNQIYHRVEEAMAAEGLRLQYGVSKVKEPAKDSSRNQSLKNWQDTQDAVQTLQHNKNIVLDVLELDYVTDNDDKDMVHALACIGDTLDELEATPATRLDKTKGVVKFSLLAQLRSFVLDLIRTYGKVKKERDFYKSELEKKPSLSHQVDYADQRAGTIDRTKENENEY